MGIKKTPKELKAMGFDKRFQDRMTRFLKKLPADAWNRKPPGGPPVGGNPGTKARDKRVYSNKRKK